MDQELYELLNTGVDFTEQLQLTASGIVEGLHEEKINEALNVLATWTEDIQVMMEALEIAQNRGIAIDVGEISTHVEELMDALENRDYVLLADIIEYDLTEILGKWNDELQKALS